MTGVVLDCSVTMAWCFEDEADPYADLVLNSLGNTPAIAPDIWALEVANALLAARRRGRITEAGLVRTMTLIRGLRVDTRHLMAGQIWTDVLAIGHEHELSSYDASYLFLALKEGLPLATLDQKLRRAAVAAGTEIYAPA